MNLIPPELEINIKFTFFSCGSFAGSNPSCVEWGTDVYPNCCKPICLKYSEEDEEE
jgi:hypothetical protein